MVSCWSGGRWIDGSRHVLKEEFQEFGDWLEVRVGQLKGKEMSWVIPSE